MYSIKNFESNDDIRVVAEKGPFKVVEYIRDLSVTPSSAALAYFMSEMNVRRRHVVCNLNMGDVITQAGAMHWSVGAVVTNTDVKSAGDLFKKALGSAVTKDSAIKPKYSGTGTLVLEPTYKHLILEDLSEWGGQIVLDDSIFLACTASLKQSVIARSNLTSAVAGGEGLFNLSLSGRGVVALECACPREELVEIVLENDTLRVDGNFAVAWSASLNFTVERSGKTLIGSAASGEGLVNVYRGTGKVLLAPLSGKLPALSMS